MISFFLILMGLIFGSFLNVVIYRIPKGMNIGGRSKCDKCKKKISWYDNIPLVSWFALGGKCRNCKNKISLQYPLIEALTAIGFLLIGPNIYWLSLFLVLLAIFVIDLKHQIIPDSLIFIGMLVALFGSSFNIFASTFAGFLMAVFLLSIHLITKGRGMGLGDVKFAVLAGMIVGVKLSIFWMFLSFLTGAIVSIILVLWKAKGLKDKIAFGPFLVASIPVSLLLNFLFPLQLSVFWPFWL